ncbi:MAG: hypothetical protein IID46_04265 [Planctomycetes bacterium]|nr:hypothetical protein [Planctomycetota bacterium]
MADQLNIRIYQFLSRRNLPLGEISESCSSPKQESEIQFRLTWSYAISSVEFYYLQDEIQHRPGLSIGAAQYINPDSSDRMILKWPVCLVGTGTVDSPESLRDSDTLKKCLIFLNQILLKRKNQGLFKELNDQLATVEGYRSAYFKSQMLDISGNRLPGQPHGYANSRTGAFIGPGVATIDNLDYPHLNEMGWFRVIPFAGATDAITDLTEIKKREESIRLHSNSNDELSMARQYLERGDLKGCIRSSAFAVETRIKYWCNLWSIRFPSNRGLTFDDKIEQSLTTAGKPSYRSADSKNLERILFLSRARNAIHEGDNYYKDLSGAKIEILRPEQAEPLFQAAVAFCTWIDSLT